MLASYRVAVKASCLLMLSLCFCFSGRAFAEKLQILRVTPSGADVAASRQITFQFNKEMVPLGRMNRQASEIPIAIEPEVACQWRWISTKTLSCNLADTTALKPATRYTIEVRPDFTAQDQSSLSKANSYEFITERAKVKDYWFDEWQAPDYPLINVYFNQEVSQDSIEQALFFIGIHFKYFVFIFIANPLVDQVNFNFYRRGSRNI